MYNEKLFLKPDFFDIIIKHASFCMVLRSLYDSSKSVYVNSKIERKYSRYFSCDIKLCYIRNVGLQGIACNSCRNNDSQWM